MNRPKRRRPWLFEQLRQRYEHPLEVEAYTRQNRHGLLTEEHAVLQLAAPRGGDVLVLGCGAGREVFALARMGYQTTGTDISQSMLKSARRVAETLPPSIVDRVHWRWMQDPLIIPFPDESFDLVIAFAQLLSHIPGREARVSLLKEVRRLLRPRGVIIASVTHRSAARELLAGGSTDDPDTDASVGPDGGSDSYVIGEFTPLERAAGWEEGDLLVWGCSEADIEEPLFFHLHTQEEVHDEFTAAGFVEVQLLFPRDISSKTAPDAHRYPFVVAKRP